MVDIEPLIRMKQTQRAKDYPVIGELARLLPPEREIELTTDPDRIVALASDLPLPEAHRRACELAERLLPRTPLMENGHGAAQ